MFMLTCLSFLLVSLLWLIRYRAAALLVSESAPGKKLRRETESKPISLSLWLIPPEGENEKIKEQMDRLAENGKRGPMFAPHITVVGGFSCPSEAHAMAIAKGLEDGLKGFGEIPILLSPTPYSAGVWNQALYLTAEVSAPFLNLCQRSRALLGMDTEDWTFPAPAVYPHLSLFYGVEDVPDKSEVEPVSPFHAYKLSLWRTDPATTEGVRQWREISTFDIR